LRLQRTSLATENEQRITETLSEPISVSLRTWDHNSIPFPSDEPLMQGEGTAQNPNRRD
jgi:hypothetical protein